MLTPTHSPLSLSPLPTARVSGHGNRVGYLIRGNSLIFAPQLISVTLTTKLKSDPLIVFNVSSRHKQVAYLIAFFKCGTDVVTCKHHSVADAMNELLHQPC